MNLALFLHHIELCAPLFIVVAVGWAMMKTRFFSPDVPKALGSFTFRFLMPVMLFDLLSDLSNMPPIDWRVLLAFFGSCHIVYILGRIGAKKCFNTTTEGTTVLAMAGIFGNNVQIGVPVVHVSLGQAAMPTVSILILFNVLLLWTVAIASVEFGRSGRITDFKAVFRPMLRVFKNPVVLGILAGCAWGLTGWELPLFASESVKFISRATAPMCLVVVGMGLAKHSFTAALPKGIFTTVMKLAVQPLLVWVIAKMIDLGELETNAAVLLAALPVAINIYLMSQEFGAEEGGASNGIFLSTFVSAVTVPLTLTLLGVTPPL
ncbi:AEC family transporter [Sutterella sp.]|uniref:AEC family transporter n=1 Tax=Sutterella sp. TaxID=1981025 RepID=UPI0026E0A090|nr:AEC family transporter [Sutterella sp.]MDO5532773.1 AEC family transporter [Sutterella sp.]